MLEDAACALGSSLRGVACGGCSGTLGTFSFHPRKVITTGEGGMVTTRDAAFATRLRTLRNHGLRGPGDFVEAGSNARLSELHAAVGVGAVREARRDPRAARALAARMREAVALRWQRAPEGAVVNHQTLGFTLPPGEHSLRATRDALVASLREGGVEAGILSYALHRLPAFAAHAVNAARRFPVADAVVDGGVAVPLHRAHDRGRRRRGDRGAAPPRRGRAMSEVVVEVNGLVKVFSTGLIRTNPRALGAPPGWLERTAAKYPWGEKLHKMVEAVRGISFEVRRGEIFGFLGPNGAGKTTTIKTLLGLIFPSAGEVKLFGRPVTDPEARRRVGFLPENPYLYQYLTAREIMDLAGRLVGMREPDARGRRDEEHPAAAWASGR